MPATDSPQILKKEVKPSNFFFYRAQTNFKDLEKMIPYSQEVYREAVRLNLMITGPLHWHYSGVLDLDSPFMLEVALPVQEPAKDYDGKFHFKRTESFKCISLIHEGSYEELQKSYNTLIEYIRVNNLASTGMHRELYVNIDFKDESSCITEIQMGTK